MSREPKIVLIMLYSAVLLCTTVLFFTIPVSAEQLVWSDEFSGSTIGADWEHMIGDGTLYGLPAGWGNNELQYYTDRSENSYVADGYLHIVARKEQYGGYSYTSARLRTKNRQDFKYGKMEVRMKLPTTKGMWPAFWMLPTDEVYGGWAASGEIDIAEAKVRDFPKQIIGAIHYGGEWPDNQMQAFYYSEGAGPKATDFSKDFHIYTCIWESNKFRWYVDGNLYGTATDWWSSGGPYPAPFDQYFHFLVNLAIGGQAPTPDQSTVWPQTLYVDYVRVYAVAGPPTTMHVNSIVCGTATGPAGTKYGKATVTIVDNNGGAVSGATVTGTFSGSFSETVSGTTDSNGVVVLKTSTAVKGPSFTFCVSGVTHPTLTYDPAANVETCDSYP